jgi:hypothetical protein
MEDGYWFMLDPKTRTSKPRPAKTEPVATRGTLDASPVVVGNHGEIQVGQKAAA